MTQAVAQDLVYRLSAGITGNRPGSHRSRSRGAGMNFVAHARLLDQPDPRRLDLRASLSNLHREWQVRVNQQRASIDILSLVDVSASMRFGAGRGKIGAVADFLNALGFSAGGYGDATGLLAFDQQQRDDLTVALRHGRGIGALMAEMVQQSAAVSNQPAKVSALADCVALAAGRAKLVFVCSDFHWLELSQLAALLDPLSDALIVPMVIWDPAELVPAAGTRLMSFRQMGGTAARHLWLTPAVRSQWQDNIERRKLQLVRAFGQSDAQPFFVTDGFSAQALTRYFLDRSL